MISFSRPLENYKYSQEPKHRGLSGRSIDLYVKYAESRGVNSDEIKRVASRLDMDLQVARGKSKLPKAKGAFVIHPRDMNLLPLDKTQAPIGNALLKLPFGPGSELRDISRKNGKFADVPHHFMGLEKLSPAEQMAVYSQHPFSLHAAYINQQGEVLGYVMGSGMSLGELAAIRTQSFASKNQSIESVADYVNQKLISDIHTAIEAGVLSEESVIGLSMTLPGPTDYGRTLRESLGINSVTGHELTAFYVNETRLRLANEVGHYRVYEDPVGIIGAGVIGWAIADHINRTGSSQRILIYDRNAAKSQRLAEEIGPNAAIATSMVQLRDGAPGIITATNNLAPLHNYYPEWSKNYIIEDSQPTLFHNPPESAPLVGVVSTTPRGIERVSLENGVIGRNAYNFGQEGLLPPNGNTPAYTCESQLLLAVLNNQLPFNNGPITPESMHIWTQAAQEIGITLPHDLQFRGKLVNPGVL